MGMPFQVADAELRKGSRKSEDDEEEKQEPEQGNDVESKPEAPQPKSEKPKPEADVCDLPPLPDFCGLFDRAMAPLQPQPAVSVNININLGGDPCSQESPMRREPQVVSFADRRDETDA